MNINYGINMNWGKKIALVYVGFVILIITMVVFSMRQKIDLVSPDYYAKELNYQSDINKISNAKALEMPMECIVLGDVIVIAFPKNQLEKTITGQVLVYKPSDNKSDRIFKFDTNTGKYDISTKDFAKGMYKIKVDWGVDNVEYQTETVIVL